MVDRPFHIYIGTGISPSVYYCAECNGYYGLPHDQGFPRDYHPHKPDDQCACRPCRERDGRETQELRPGVFGSWPTAEQEQIVSLMERYVDGFTDRVLEAARLSYEGTPIT